MQLDFEKTKIDHCHRITPKKKVPTRPWTIIWRLTKFKKQKKKKKDLN